MTQNINAQPMEDFSQYPWFHSGVPREVILEYLSQQEMGSFVIRESTSELGCYALSLKVRSTYYVTLIDYYAIKRWQRYSIMVGCTQSFA